MSWLPQTLLWFGMRGLSPAAALAELHKSKRERQIFVSFRSVISPNLFPLQNGSIIFEMAVSHHAFSMGHQARLCLGTDCHKLLRGTSWLGLRKYSLYASAPAAQNNSWGKMLQMWVNYSVFKVLYAHGKQQVTSWCTLAPASTLLSPVIHRCLRNKAINKSDTAVNIQEQHFNLSYVLSRAY